MSSTSKITAFGELLVDMITEAGSDTLTRRPGGAPANFAAGCALLGHETDLITCVGEDAFGRFLVEAIEDVGVDTAQIQRSQQRTTLAITQLDEDGVPSFMFYRDANADTEITTDAIDDQRLADSDHLHFGALSLTDEPVSTALKQVLEEFEGQVSFDPNLREDLMDDGMLDEIQALLGHVDILLCAQDELAALASTDSGLPEQAQQLITDHGLQEIVVTQGRSGATVVTAGAVTEIPAVECAVTDTTGAGDAFAAGYVTGRLEGQDIADAGQRGSRVAARCIESTGAIEGLPDRDDVVEE